MPIYQAEELLILAKTYPSPSAKHRETTCVAAINRGGELRRIFPISYRFLDGPAQFKRWEWIAARMIKAPSDNRPESYRIDQDTITILNERVDTANGWSKRRQWFEPHVMDTFHALENRRQTTGETLGFVKPTRIIALDIKPVKETDWTPEDIQKLTQEGLFDSAEVKARPPLEKLAHDFYYVYECETPHGIEQGRHKITDWEVGALYRNCRRSHGANWEKPFRDKLETDFSKKDLHFLMGTIHRFPDQWLIVGLVYPPKPELGADDQQLALF